MPRYAYECEQCNWTDIFVRSITERVLSQCPNCHDKGELRPLITTMHHPHTISPVVSNHQFNHGMGEYDVGLGAVVHSREEQQRIMKQKGLEEITQKDMDDAMSNQLAEPPPAVTIDEVKDLWDEAAARVERGEGYTDDYPVPDKSITPEIGVINPETVQIIEETNE